VFGEVIPPGTDPVGGWQAMCIRIHIQFERHVDDISEGLSPTFTCSMEIGFPIAPQKRARVSADEARRVTARALNKALGEMDTNGPTVTVCGDLMSRTRKSVTDDVKGAKINKNCGHIKGKARDKIPEVSWP
jgi:hypothetical protein